MSESGEFLLGEYRRLLDERFRLSIPAELLAALVEDTNQPDDAKPGFVLAKERPGALSLWHEQPWQQRHEQGLRLVREKMRAGRLEGRVDEVQQLGRLLSTRHRAVTLAGKGRLLIPEGFREFLAVEPGSEVLVVGAAVCVEIWKPAAWFEYLEANIPSYRRLFEDLSA